MCGGSSCHSQRLSCIGNMSYPLTLTAETSFERCHCLISSLAVPKYVKNCVTSIHTWDVWTPQVTQICVITSSSTWWRGSGGGFFTTREQFAFRWSQRHKVGNYHTFGLPTDVGQDIQTGTNVNGHPITPPRSPGLSQSNPDSIKPQICIN